ncbi:hypothetical protein [Sphingomonas azotifigens]|uniref:hypothetical protein n=1 Tax=Sphingomonas azotifigens TaxID=330920 RepID=UPI00111C32AE|nr:hypothetical protein [Sphingomonas azotifigens]
MTKPPAPAATSQVEIACEHCGHLGVMREAWAEWSVAKQGWVLSQTFDFAFCMHCHRPTRIVTRAVADVPPKPMGSH